MATTLKEIAEFLTSADLKFETHEDKDYILTGFAMPHYKNPEGKAHLLIVIALEEQGEFLKIFTPKAYHYEDGPHALAILKACMYISWRTKMLQYEFDPSDGEIRAMIEFPLEDAKLTKRQLMRVLMALPELIDRYDAMIRAAIATGKLETGGEPDAALLSLLEGLGDVKPEEMVKILEEIKKHRKDKGDKDGKHGPSKL
jgi:hypothetical protein